MTCLFVWLVWRCQTIWDSKIQDDDFADWLIHSIQDFEIQAGLSGLRLMAWGSQSPTFVNRKKDFLAFLSHDEDPGWPEYPSSFTRIQFDRRGHLRAWSQHVWGYSDPRYLLWEAFQRFLLFVQLDWPLWVALKWAFHKPWVSRQCIFLPRRSSVRSIQFQCQCPSGCWSVYHQFLTPPFSIVASLPRWCRYNDHTSAALEIISHKKL